MYRRAFQELNLIHRIPLSILEEGYVDNDISFINWGIESYVASPHSQMGSRVAWLLVEFIKEVPDGLRSKITWTAPDALLEYAATYVPQSYDP